MPYEILVNPIPFIKHCALLLACTVVWPEKKMTTKKIRILFLRSRLVVVGYYIECVFFGNSQIMRVGYLNKTEHLRPKFLLPALPLSKYCKGLPCITLRNVKLRSKPRSVQCSEDKTYANFVKYPHML